MAESKIQIKLELVGPTNAPQVMAGLRNQVRGVQATVGLNTAAAEAGLAKITTGSRSAAASLNAVRAASVTAATSLSATVSVTNSGANAFRNFAEQAGLAARRFVAFSVAAGSMVRAVQGLKEGVRAAVEFDLSMNKVEQVSTETADRVAGLRKEIGSLATGLGVSSAALAETAITLKQAGLTVGQTTDALKALALTDLAPTFDSMKQSTEGLIAAFRQFNLNSKEFEGTLSSMNAVSAQFAVESSDIISAVQRAGGAFKLTAGDMKSGSEALNEFMALFTSVRATTRESADTIATGLRTVFTRFQRADTVKALQDLGVNLRYTREEANALGQTNMQDQFVGAYEAVKRLSEGLAGLRETDPRYAQVIEQLGGYRQISRVIPLLKEFKTAEEAKNIAIAGGLSLQVAAEKRQETLSNKVVKLKEEYLNLFRNLTQDKGFQVLANSLLGVASGFAKVLDFARPLLPLLTAFAAVKIGTNLGNLVGGFASSFVAPPGSAIGRRSGPLRFATGGVVPGSGNADTEHALLTPGEFVLNKQAVARMGVPQLRELNEGRGRLRLARYAKGSSDPVGGVVPVPGGDGGLKPALDALTAALNRLAAAGVKLSPGVALKPEELNAVAGLAEKTPAGVRAFLGKQEGGYAQTIAAGNLPADPGVAGIANAGQVTDKFRGVSGVVGGKSVASFVSARAALADAAAAGQAGGRSTLLHEQGHDLDRSLALRTGTRASESAAFRAVQGDALGHLSKDVKFKGVEKPAELFAESYGRFVKGGDAKAQLPASVQGYFEKLVADLTKQVEQAAGRAAPASGRGSSLLARLKAKQPPTPKPTDDIPALSFVGEKKVRPADAPFQYVGGQVAADSSAAEAAREKAARAFFDKQTAAKTVEAAPSSFVSQLKTPEQFAFFQKYTVGRGDKRSLADAAAENQARRSGDIGAAGVASGAAQDAAHEAVARLAVQGAPGFDPKNPRAAGYVVNTVRSAVRERLTAEYGAKASKFGGYVPLDADGRAVETAGREADPSAPVNADADIVRAKAREAEKAARLAQVKAALPGGTLPADRAGRIEFLRSFGEGKTQAVGNAAQGRFDQAAASHLRDRVVPPDAGEPPSNFVGAAPGGGAGKRVRDGVHRVGAGGLEAFGRSLGQSPEQLKDFAERVREQVARAGRQKEFAAGTFDAAIDVRNGGFTKVVGTGRRRDSLLPQPQSEIAEYADRVQGRVIDTAPAGAATRLGGGRFVVTPKAKPGLTDAELSYQFDQLTAAKAKLGDTYGVPGDVLARRDRFDRARETATAQGIGLRRAAADFTDPLVLARDTRGERFEARRREQREVGLRLNASAGNAGDGITPQGTVGDRITSRALRDAAGIGGVTDPLAIKQAAVRAFQNGEGGYDVLKAAESRLSPAQYGQVRKAAERAGFDVGGDLRSSLRGPSTADIKSVTAAEFAEGKDGSRTLTGGLLAQRARAVADSRLNALGGARNLSDGTAAAIRSQAAVDEEIRVKRELVRAQQRLLALTNPQMAATERYKTAVEDAEKAMAGLAKVSKDSRGRLLGLSDTVARATQAGISAPGAGGRVYDFKAGLSDRLTNLREFAGNNRLTRFNEKLRGVSSNFGLGSAVALGGAATYGATKLDESAGNAEDAAKSASRTADFKSYKSAAGALQGGLIGAATGGAIFGPLGAAVGGVVGAFAGFRSALIDAEKDIRQAKIANALTELGDKLSAFGTGIPDALALAGIKKNFDTYRGEANAKAKADSTGFFSRNFGSNTPDIDKYAENSRLNFRKDVGPLLPQLYQGVAKQAEALGKANPNRPLASLAAELERGNGGLNAEFTRIIAELKGVPVKQVQDEFKKALASAQTSGRIEQESRRAKQLGDQDVNTFGRLYQAVAAASDSLAGLQRRAAALTDVLDGAVTASKVSANADRLDEGFGRADKAALAPLDLVAAATGNYRLRRVGAGADAVANALPSVLGAVAGERGLTETNITSSVSAGLYKSLGYGEAKSAPEEIQRAVAAVVAGLNDSQDRGKGVGGFREEVGTDATKFSEKLLASAVDPVREFGGKVARQLEDNANRLVDGLTAVNQRMQQVGQLYDQLAQARAGNFRQDLQVRADAAGRGNQALDYASVARLEAASTARQQRLSGAEGRLAFDPAFLGRELGAVRDRIGPAVERQQQAFEQTGGKGPAFAQAAEEVVRLKDRAANLQQALKNLADASERNAVVQEKLARLKQEEEGRLGLAERYATADGAEQLRMGRGFILANQAAQAGNIDRFGAEDRRLIIDTLKGAGGVTLTGFQGSPRADDLLKNLLSNSFGGDFRLNAGQRKERADLQGLDAGRRKTAEEAIAQLAEFQKAGADQLLKGLGEQQTQFFAKLERLLLLNARQDVTNQRARAAAEVGALEEKGVPAALLARVGVTTSPQLAALQTQQGKVDALRAAVAAQKADQQRFEDAKAGIDKFAPTSGELNDVQFLQSRGFDDKVTARVAKRANELSTTGELRERLIAANDATSVDAVNREALRRSLLEEKARDTGKPVRDARDALKGIQGVNPDKLLEVLSGPDAEKFGRALTEFDTSGNKLEDFGRKLSDAKRAVEVFDAELRRLTPAGRTASPNDNTSAAPPRVVEPMPNTSAAPTRTVESQPALIDLTKPRPSGVERVPASGGVASGLIQMPLDLRAPPSGGAERMPIDATAPRGEDDVVRMRARGYAAGGSIFRPQGTDTVPAMLTPGEFVVNARSSSANRALLHRINESRGQAVDFKQGGEPTHDYVPALVPPFGFVELPYPRVRTQSPIGMPARLAAGGEVRDHFGLTDADGAFRERKGDARFGYAAFAAQADLLNRQAADGVRRRRPGEDGQLSIAARVAAARNKQFDDRFRTDPALRRFVERGVAPQVHRFAAGGYVPGVGSSDTVPSLLTPGEFVLNKGAVNRIGVNNVQRFNAGGLVGASGSSGPSGGLVGDDAVRAMTALASSMAPFGGAAAELAQAFGAFGRQSGELAKALSEMPRTLSIMARHDVNVNVNGAEVMAKLTPEIRGLVVSSVKSELGRVFKDHLPDLGVSL